MSTPYEMTEKDLLDWESQDFPDEPEWDEFYFDPDDTYGTLKY